ncbi:MAG: DUF1788 domain-containing protein [Deltaproteobacteria bacterium HGW-Deltaproteobacteria-17]|nr:MAG: DUF1788 domain-containing protein [Deltaproteobacteria bacterium HGW-Deltaproteobacteria-17]
MGGPVIQIFLGILAAPAQRVIFAVYEEADELRLRLKIPEFALATREAHHSWCLFDLTDTFANWLAAEKYAQSYFEEPELLATLLPSYMDHLVERFSIVLAQQKADPNTVVALSGVGSLFGFLKVRDLVEQLAPQVSGRLLVLFPGTCDNNNYRLLDGYDGWNYLAVTLTANQDL